MKKAAAFAAAVILAVTATAYSESTEQPEQTSLQADEAQTAGNSQKKGKYFKPISGWVSVKGEGIYTGSDEYVFHLDSGEMSASLDAAVVPLNADDKQLSYSSSDTDVVTVSPDGVLSASNHAGSATIYITTESGLYKECKVEVRRAVTGVSLSDSDLTFYADRPVERRITANVFPADATNKEVTWSSSDTSVAGVDENGNISTCGVGTATITAQTVDGGFKASCTVRSTVYDITVKGVFINNPIDAIPVGSSYALTASVYPDSARDKGISWSSDSPQIISVDANGNLQAHAEGAAVITASANNGVSESFALSAVTVPEGQTFEYTSSYESVEVRREKLSVPVKYTDYASSYADALHAQLRQSPTVFTTNARSASQSDVEEYLNPSNGMSGALRYQFLDLSEPSNVSERMLNVYLSDKGVLKGKGEVFRRAAVNNHVNAAYLAVHACLESGSGTSQLASGINYQGTTVYNMFGIGAYDEDPINGGAKYAYEHGWTSVDAAIEGGAQWISENYINAGQNTLYKMKWNPAKPGTHQYATDVAWAAKQARTLQTFMDVFPISQMSFEVPVYAGSDEPIMKYE